jgi:hypothetical protein
MNVADEIGSSEASRPSSGATHASSVRPMPRRSDPSVDLHHRRVNA